MPISIDRLGSSTLITGSGRGSSGSVRVSPMATSSMPAIAGSGFLDGDARELLRHRQVGDLHALGGAVDAAAHHGLAAPEDAVAHAAEREAAEVRRGIEIRHEGLQRVALLI
jgi:hypothetical protein